MRRLTRAAAAVLATAVITAGAGCMVKSTEAPPLSGPSELGLSLALSATPDILPQDGWSQATVGIEARGADGRPARAVTVRVETVRGGLAADYGLLSSRSAVTDENGRARISYTAPAAGEPVDTNTVVTIRVTPVGSNYANAVSREVQIRLTPPGVILPPNGTPVPEFTYSPSAPQVLQDVYFDASPTTDDGASCATCTYDWSMGDGSARSGLRVTHSYSAPGGYVVRLTVTDPGGRSASISKSVTVGTGTRPTASFSFSPSSPGVSQDIFFTAATSTAAPGRRIVAYDWDFGSGRTASGVTAVKRYDTAGTYVVTLLVTDDLGQTGAVSQSVTVASLPRPTAAFTFTPASPVVGQDVLFSAAASSASPGRTISGYSWTFGPSRTASGVSAVTQFDVPGSIVVTLVVTDDAGQTGTVSQTVTVTSGDRPTAAFSFSPTSPGVSQDVFFTAAGSSAGVGRRLVSFEWNFGTGATATGLTPVTRFNSPGIYAVTLRVVDDVGNSATASQSVQVQPSASGGISASLVASPTSPKVNQAIQFNAAGSRPSDGATLVEYRFNFGVPGVADVVGSSPIVNFTYTTAGTYVVTVQVRDSAGRTAMASITITVTN